MKRIVLRSTIICMLRNGELSEPHVVSRIHLPLITCREMPPNALSLKQRLAALSNSPSSPTSPYGQEPPRSPLGTRRKPFFNPPWAKRQHETFVGNGAYGESEKVQQVMAKMIFQAGVDFELVLHRFNHYVFHLTMRVIDY